MVFLATMETPFGMRIGDINSRKGGPARFTLLQVRIDLLYKELSFFGHVGDETFLI